MTNNDIAQKVAARYRSASVLQVGDHVTVWMKRGNWWSDMRRGNGFTIKRVEGDSVWLHDGSSMGGAFEMRVKSGPDANGRIVLEATGDWLKMLKRGLVVTKDAPHAPKKRYDPNDPDTWSI